MIPDLDDPIDRVAPGGVNQQGQLVQGRLGRFQPGVGMRQADEDRPLALLARPDPSASQLQRSFRARAIRSAPSARRRSSMVSEKRT